MSDEKDSGSLADAISAHLALKREHGADPDSVEQERDEALSPARRDEPEPAQPEPEPARAPEPEPAPAPEPAPEPVLEAEPEPEPEPEPAPAQPAAEAPAPGEITGTIEFEFGDEGQPAEPDPVSEHDLLEDTPDFFEETPEHDKLWFDEAPPRKFDF
jgi:outer membrane biosynthesis protein TonB